jgi:serine/threonine-protein kinase
MKGVTMKPLNLMLSLLLSALVAAGVTYGMNRYGITFGFATAAKGSEAAAAVDAPSLIGLRPDQARALLEARGLLLLIDQEQPDPRVEPGKICRQEPLEGSRLRRGDSVRADVSRAPDAGAVPTVVGRSAARAREILGQAGFNIGELRYQSNEDRSEGLVLEQSPPAGVPATKGSKIDLVVNRLN